MVQAILEDGVIRPLDERDKIDTLLALKLREAVHSQVSLQHLMDEIGQEAQARGLTPAILRSILGGTATEWPESVVRAIGSWPDAPTAEEIREGMGQDVPREPL